MHAGMGMRLTFTRQPLRLCAVILPPATASTFLRLPANNRTFISATARKIVRLTAHPLREFNRSY